MRFSCLFPTKIAKKKLADLFKFQNICLFKVKNTILRIFVKKSLQYFTGFTFVLPEVITLLYIVCSLFPC